MKKNNLEKKIIEILKRKFPKIYGKQIKNSKINFDELDSLQKINLLMDIEKDFRIKFNMIDFEKIMDLKNLILIINKK
jgi:acyl carrier protein